MQEKYLRNMIKYCKENNMKHKDVMDEIDYRYNKNGNKNNLFNQYSTGDLLNLITYM